MPHEFQVIQVINKHTVYSKCHIKSPSSHIVIFPFLYLMEIIQRKQFSGVGHIFWMLRLCGKATIVVDWAIIPGNSM